MSSRFYRPCCEILANASEPLSATQVKKLIIKDYPNVQWSGYLGPVRGVLLRASTRTKSPIQLVPDSNPPLFYYSKKKSSKAPSPFSQQKSNKGFSNKGSESGFTTNSMFFQPCCELLSKLNEKMSANQLMKLIRENYPQIQWGGTQGPVRAMLLNVSQKEGSPIHQVPQSSPPLFFYSCKPPVDNRNDTLVSIEETPEEVIERAFDTIVGKLREALLEKIYSISPFSFEDLVNNVIAEMGYGRPETTQKTNDGGLDGKIYADRLGLNVVGVQSKHYGPNRKVQCPEIHSFIGALYGKDGIFVTSSDFSKGAKEAAYNSKSSRIVLINGRELVDYMIEYNVGVQNTKTSYVIKDIDADYFDNL